MVELDFSSFLPKETKSRRGAADPTDFAAFTANSKEVLDKIDEATKAGHTINFGRILPENRNAEATKQAFAFNTSLPRFGIRGRFSAAERRYPLWSYGKKVLGNFLPYNWQQTGSCVGAGGGNMAKSSICVEIALKGDNEVYKELWWLYTYGMARLILGDGGVGEGCTGEAWAEAALKEGFFEIDPEGLPDLPDYKITQGWIVQPSSIEFKWSAGRNIAEQWRKLGHTHLFKTAAKINSATQAIEALMNGYVLTQASNFGFSNPKMKGTTNPIRVATWNGSWSHQTYIDEYWDHPEVGPVVRWGNNWGPGAHGDPTGDEPPGGVYIEEKTLDQICRNGEVYAFSQFDGFPARELNFAAF